MRRSRTIVIAAASILAAVGAAAGTLGTAPSAGAAAGGIRLRARQDLGLTDITLILR